MTGRIVSDRQVRNREFWLDLTIPTQAFATVSLLMVGKVLEGMKSASQAEG